MDKRKVESRFILMDNMLEKIVETLRVKHFWSNMTECGKFIIQNMEDIKNTSHEEIFRPLLLKTYNCCDNCIKMYYILKNKSSVISTQYFDKLDLYRIFLLFKDDPSKATREILLYNWKVLKELEIRNEFYKNFKIYIHENKKYVSKLTFSLLFLILSNDKELYNYLYNCINQIKDKAYLYTGYEEWCFIYNFLDVPVNTYGVYEEILFLNWLKLTFLYLSLNGTYYEKKQIGIFSRLYEMKRTRLEIKNIFKIVCALCKRDPTNTKYFKNIFSTISTYLNISELKNISIKRETKKLEPYKNLQVDKIATQCNKNFQTYQFNHESTISIDKLHCINDSSLTEFVETNHDILEKPSYLPIKMNHSAIEFIFMTIEEVYIASFSFFCMLKLEIEYLKIFEQINGKVYIFDEINNSYEFISNTVFFINRFPYFEELILKYPKEKTIEHLSKNTLNSFFKMLRSAKFNEDIYLCLSKWNDVFIFVEAIISEENNKLRKDSGEEYEPNILIREILNGLKFFVTFFAFDITDYLANLGDFQFSSLLEQMKDTFFKIVKYNKYGEEFQIYINIINTQSSLFGVKSLYLSHEQQILIADIFRKIEHYHTRYNILPSITYDIFKLIEKSDFIIYKLYKEMFSLLWISFDGYFVKILIDLLPNVKIDRNNDNFLIRGDWIPIFNRINYDYNEFISNLYAFFKKNNITVEKSIKNKIDKFCKEHDISTNRHSVKTKVDNSIISSLKRSLERDWAYETDEVARVKKIRRSNCKETVLDYKDNTDSDGSGSSKFSENFTNEKYKNHNDNTNNIANQNKKTKIKNNNSDSKTYENNGFNKTCHFEINLQKNYIKKINKNEKCKILNHQRSKNKGLKNNTSSGDEIYQVGIIKRSVSEEDDKDVKEFQSATNKEKFVVNSDENLYTRNIKENRPFLDNKYKNLQYTYQGNSNEKKLNFLTKGLKERIFNSFSYNVLNGVSAIFDNIPSEFISFEQYFFTFEQFLFLEVKENIIRGKENEIKPIIQMIVDDFIVTEETLDLFCYIEHVQNINDYSIIEIRNLFSIQTEKPVIGIIRNIKKEENCIFINISAQLSKNIHKQMILDTRIVYNFWTSLKEYESLCILKYLKICDFITNPMESLQNLNNVVPNKSNDIINIYEDKEALIYKLYKENLNNSQCNAIINCIFTDKPFVLIKGPPGTGKTQMISSLVKFLNGKIMICAPSNAAIDELTSRLYKDGIDILRISYDHSFFDSDENNDNYINVNKNVQNVPYNLNAIVNKMMEKYKLIVDKNKYFKMRNKFKVETIKSARVISSTLSTSGIELLNFLDIDYLIIDECCQSVELSTLIPMRYNPSKVILVGDPNQLPPTLISKIRVYEQSLFQRLQNIYDTVILDQQYRMNPEISRIPNRLFYSNAIKDDQSVIIRKNPYKDINCGRFFYFQNETDTKYDEMKYPSVSFINIEGNEVSHKSSYYNELECEYVVNILKMVFVEVKNYNLENKIGVITFYREQSERIKEYLKINIENYDKYVTVSTVDAFQGGEKDFIIISCVRTTSPGFLNDIRRLNVALTRAKFVLTILGNINVFKFGIWKELVKEYEFQGLLYKNFMIVSN